MPMEFAFRASCFGKKMGKKMGKKVFRNEEGKPLPA